MINVTKTFLPPLADYLPYLEKMWETTLVTNFGTFSRKLMADLTSYLQVPQLLFVSNGTVAIQLAIKALDLKNEIITTPFSYVATTSSIVWENCKPIFADIEPDTLTICPADIEKRITPRTTAILATHVYGNPCNVEAIQQIAQQHKLKVIYDAAHCFGVQYKGSSLFNYGDVSTTSFHATKLFHTIEGGGVICNDFDLFQTLVSMGNFGHVNKFGYLGNAPFTYTFPEEFLKVGINAKNSELHAAVGLCVLQYVDQIIERRKKLSQLYDELLADCPQITRPTIRPNTTYNYAYYPILLPSEQQLKHAQSMLNAHEIYPRRYFYPSLSALKYLKGKQQNQYPNTPIANQAAQRALCLPLYYELTEDNIQLISNTLKQTLK